MRNPLTRSHAGVASGPALLVAALLWCGSGSLAMAADDPAPDEPAPAPAASAAAEASGATPATPAAAPAPPPPPRGTSGYMGPRGAARKAPPAPRPSPNAARRPGGPYNGMRMTEKETQYLAAAWGIDHVHVASTGSGNLLKFTFRVVEPKLAKALGDHEAQPYIFAPRAHAVLQVPTMEQIGQLRQLHTDEANKEYWIAFSNKGTLVKRGDRVDVIIGKFRAPGLLVE
jgi:hypothetical protein